VVLNTGSPVTLPWAAEVPALLQTWFGGQEMADALVDVLVGAAEPGGRLPVTFPERLEHGPAYGNFPGENGVVRYGEGVLMGYRWFDARHLPTRFPFGHGLSYTSFAIGDPVPSAAALAGVDDVLTVDVPVTNTGDRSGSEVVQLYVAPPGDSRLVRPPKELRAFAKVALAPGETRTVRLTLDVRSFACWDPGQADRPDIEARMRYLPVMAGRRPRPRGWHVDAGVHRLLVGRSAAAIDREVVVDVPAPLHVPPA
jgi:beta-glucosidase